MTVPDRLDLLPEHRRLVRDILAGLLPANAKVWAFGSRTTGRAHQYSDLDLAIDAERRLSLDELASLREAFSDSDLPFRVDVLDWQAADDRFRALITANRLLLSEGPVDG